MLNPGKATTNITYKKLSLFMLMKLTFSLVFFVLMTTGLAKLSLKQLASPSYATSEIDDLQREIDELGKLKKMSEDATGNLERSVKDLVASINNAQDGITQAEQQSEELSQDIKKRETALATQYTVLKERVAVSYKRMRIFNPIMVFFASNDVANLTKDIIYNARVQDQDTDLISAISQDIIQLEADKKALEARQVQLAKLQVQLDEQKKFFEKEIAGAKEYQQTLGTQIAELSARQQAIIVSRTGTYTTSVGEVPLADDFNASIGYKAQAPGNSFAIFSFGAYTHRNGMSQYGAKARADSGQGVEEILQAYYPGSTLKKDYSVMENITVDGVGSINFEAQYLMGIYEMPATWHINALKAQAIAARTYAVRYTNNGERSICTTEACQVFKNSPKGGDWATAVTETRGWVLVDGGGSPVSTQYASTHGGYANTSGWDLAGGYDASNWSTSAWEAKANSPWFYKSWYRSGYSSSGASCNRSHPWLSQTEMADILNAWIVRNNANGADTSRILPVTINECSIGGQTGNPYSMDELRDQANNSGGAVTSISGVSVSHNSNGQTTQVSFSTNRGNLSLGGSEFKEIFNLRAPGYLRIPQTGFAFFNIEHKN